MNSLFYSFALSLILLGDWAWIALIAPNKRATVSNLFCKKEQHEGFRANHSQKPAICLQKKIKCFICFWHFITVFPFLGQWTICSRHSLLSHCFLKNDGSDLVALDKRAIVSEMFPSLFTDREWLAPFAHDKTSTGAIHSFSRANRSFARKKTSDSLEKPMSEFPNLIVTKYCKYMCFFRNYRRYFVKFTPVEAHYIFWSVRIKWTLWQSILTKVVQRGISWVIFINGILKGIVSRDFRCLQQILMDRAWVPGIPLDVYFF